VLVTDGVAGACLRELKSAVKRAGGQLVIVAPGIGGVKDADGKRIPADEKVDGGPSVVFDAVALAVSEQGAKALARMPAALDFVSDAWAHCKFIGYTAEAQALLKRAGLPRDGDDGCILLEGKDSAGSFLKACARLRHWPREAQLN
jgi:catalase